ncbi:ParB/RepB/Spo0J family partition protein [Actinoplanes oblitus]|uniref:ParB/RepB/Spo0J family partition protein n=1 Tax=Actinoplanes oblitus TaxID=3040509 RepID=A0ABY8WBH8_9ACTN|nr:ParB/RepB/Spo0J family partition protein [Actinoplanes oblitus]WIM94443.1 ParB/RepB/Spo0J family partition protein [Actinoplanes oblitus]
MTPEEEDINRQPVVEMEISSLQLTGSPRLAGADMVHVEAMAAVQQELPPILVHRATMRVIDGAHRVRAALRRGETTIAGRFFEGPEDEAFVLSVWLNVAHGLPLALADRKHAAERIAVTHPQWSDRRVAAVTGISPGTVADIRRRVAGASAPESSRIGQDGRVRPLDCSAGRLLAGQLMTENPHLSLRQVAKAASISPETARDVRNRLLSGAELVPSRRGRDAGQRTAEGAGPDRQPLNLVRSIGRQEPVIDRAVVIKRLMSDPALRYTDTGRNLLRLLSLHSHWANEWETIVDNVPAHCTGVVADLARQFAELWADFATRVPEHRLAS